MPIQNNDTRRIYGIQKAPNEKFGVPGFGICGIEITPANEIEAIIRKEVSKNEYKA